MTPNKHHTISHAWGVVGCGVSLCDGKRKFIKQFFKPKMLYEDMTRRTLPTEFIGLDLYVCGFPCQPYSRAGSMQGAGDERCAEPLLATVEAIVELMPKSFILENVPALKEKFGEVLDHLIKTLRDIKSLDNTTQMYEVHFNILDTNVHGGLPQSRRRLYMVGIRSDDILVPFRWPEACAPVPLDKILKDEHGSSDDFSRLSRTKQSNIMKLMDKYSSVDMEADDYIGEIGNSLPYAMKNACPCLTHSRAGDHGYWSLRRHRTLTTWEMMKLQGVPRGRFDLWELAVNNRTMGQMAGNAMSVSILTKITKNIFNSLGIPTKA